MFFTARQLDTLHRETGGNGRVVLPYRARLTPAAQDWLRLKKVVLGYADDAFRGQAEPAVLANAGVLPAATQPAAAAGTMLWWCDGPCGAAKAAITAQERESSLRSLDLPADAKQLVSAIKAIAREVKAGSASAAVLLVRTSAAATVLANRCSSLRAVVGTSLEAVEQGIQQAAANVLVIEHPQKTLPQIKTMLARFARAKRDVGADLLRQIAELMKE